MKKTELIKIALRLDYTVEGKVTHLQDHPWTPIMLHDVITGAIRYTQGKVLTVQDSHEIRVTKQMPLETFRDSLTYGDAVLETSLTVVEIIPELTLKDTLKVVKCLYEPVVENGGFALKASQELDSDPHHIVFDVKVNEGNKATEQKPLKDLEGEGKDRPGLALLEKKVDQVKTFNPVDSDRSPSGRAK